MKIDLYYQQQKYRPMALLSGDMRIVGSRLRFESCLTYGALQVLFTYLLTLLLLIVDDSSFQCFRWLFL